MKSNYAAKNNMVIAIISDIHDNLVNLTKCLNWCQNAEIKKIISCGDMTTLLTIKNLAKFNGEIFMVKGNIDLYEETQLSKYKNIKYYGASGLIELDGLKIGLVHEPTKINILLKSTEVSPDYIFYGHTHKPWLEKRGPTSIINPGNLAGVWHQATFATLDTKTKKLELKILADI